MVNRKTVRFRNKYDNLISFIREGNVVVVTGFDHLYKVNFQLDYNVAYEKFCHLLEDFDLVSLEEFSALIHTSEGMSDTYSKYLKCTNKIATIDPAGGPFICVGMDLGTVHEAMSGLEVLSIELKENTIILKVK